MKELSVIIPTIKSREKQLPKTLAAYDRTIPEGIDYELVVVFDKPSCGAAWQVGVEQSVGEYLHLSADDIEPLEGWYDAALLSFDEKQVPIARVLRPDGSLESCVAWETPGKDGQKGQLVQIPFCSSDFWDEHVGQMIPIQYYSDDWFTHCAKKAGYEPIVNNSYSFVHHRPRGQRPNEAKQMKSDRIVYDKWIKNS